MASFSIFTEIIAEIGLQSVGCTKKIERIKRREGSALEALPSFPLSAFFAQGFFTRTRKLFNSHLQYRHVGSKKRCDVFILCKKFFLYKRVFQRRWTIHRAENTFCGDGVSLTFLAVMRCSLIFLRCGGVQGALMSPSSWCWPKGALPLRTRMSGNEIGSCSVLCFLYFFWLRAFRTSWRRW